MSTSDPTTGVWTTSLTDSPNVHIWYAAEDEPVHEASADCACAPVASSLSADAAGTLYLHQTVTPSPPPAPLPGGETHEELPHTFALIEITQTPQVVLQIGHQPNADPPPAVDGQEWIDITDADPEPSAGWVYDGTSFAPSPTEQRTQAALDTNAAFLKLDNPSDAEQLDQLRALTQQVSDLLGGFPVGEPPPGELPPVEEPDEPEVPEKPARYIDSADPDEGPQSGGVPITLHGGGFTGVGGVRFEQEGTPDAWAWGFQVLDDNTMTVTIPPGKGVVDIVLLANQDTIRLDEGFTYV